MALLFFAPAVALAERPALTYGLAGVEVGFDENAQIEWNGPDEPGYEIERDLIRVLFEGAVTDAASTAMIGDQPAILKVSVVRFDILSTFELFFCCAVNEVVAQFELIEPQTGRQLVDPTLLRFDHIGRGGLLGFVASERGDDQLQRLAKLIREGAAEWIETTE